jgi:WXG100 family type VII secretion target
MPEGGYGGSVQQFTDMHVKVVNAKELIEGELKVIWDAVVALQGQWSGDAQKAFHSMMERFDNDGKNLNSALEGIAEQLQSSGSTYHEKEASQQDVFGKLAQQLNPE